VARRFETAGAEIATSGFAVERYRCTYTTSRPPTEAERQRLEALSRSALKVCEDTLRAKHAELLGAAARTLENVTFDLDVSLAGRSDTEVAQAWGRRLADVIVAALSRQATPALAAASDGALKAPADGEAAAPQPGTTNVTVSTQTFDVEAETLDGAAAALDTRDEWGKTRWQVAYTYETADDVVTSAAVTAKIVIELPRWTRLGRQPRRVQARSAAAARERARADRPRADQPTGG